jgi:hypothetical protein
MQSRNDLSLSEQPASRRRGRDDEDDVEDDSSSNDVLFLSVERNVRGRGRGRSLLAHPAAPASRGGVAARGRGRGRGGRGRGRGGFNNNVVDYFERFGDLDDEDDDADYNDDESERDEAEAESEESGHASPEMPGSPSAQRRVSAPPTSVKPNYIPPVEKRTRPHRYRSRAWECFVQVKGTDYAWCTLCGSADAWYSTNGSTSAILLHYSDKHPQEFAANQNNPVEIPASEIAGDIRTFTSMGPRERAIIDDAIIRYFAKDLLPFNHCSKDGFIDFVSTLTKNRYPIAQRKFYTD